MTQMPTDFPAWYATVEAGRGGKATIRWNGVASAVTNNVDDIEHLVRIALKSRHEPSKEYVDGFIAKVRASDETFDSSAAEREIRILAAAALTSKLDGSPFTALALTTTSLDGARRIDLPMDIVTMAENSVKKLAASSRARPVIADLKFPKIKWPITEGTAVSKEPTDIVRELKEAVDTTLEASASQINTTLKTLMRWHSVADEELQMLWWLIGGHLSSGEPLDGLKAPARPLTVGRELAQRTLFRPGPLAVPALLSKAGVNRKGTIKIAVAVNAMGDEWCRETISDLSISPVTHPIHEAVRRRAETGANEDWIKAWAAWCEVDDDLALPPLRFGELFYREHVLLTVER